MGWDLSSVPGDPNGMLCYAASSRGGQKEGFVTFPTWALKGVAHNLGPESLTANR